jgi:hypothetical protein
MLSLQDVVVLGRRSNPNAARVLYTVGAKTSIMAFVT